MNDEDSSNKMSTTTKVAIISAVATIVAALITVIGPTIFNPPNGNAGNTPSTSPTPATGEPSPSPTDAHPDIELSAETVAMTTGVLGPPTNPMTEYQALTSAWRRTGDGRVEPVPPSPEEPRRTAKWAFQATPGVYRLLATYANASQPQEDRTLDVAINGVTVLSGKFGTQTGGWLPQDRIVDEALGEVRLKRGTNIIEISCPSSRNFPHVSSLKLQYLRP